MNAISLRHIRTGSDPRSLPDYAALRDELSKLTHPARPDVNWHYVEKLCLSLFEQNGVELQTAAWYTLVRTELAGLSGLNEGLAILEALTGHQWGRLWPQPLHARATILSSLSLRLQQRLRGLSVHDSDLHLLYQAEQRLANMEEILQHLALKHLSQFTALRTLIHSHVVRLEKSQDISPGQPEILPPAAQKSHYQPSGDTLSYSQPPDSAGKNSGAKWVYIAHQQPEANVDVLSAMPAAAKKWPVFIAGMVTMLMAGSIGAGIWFAFLQPDPLQVQLAASLAPFPDTLTREQLASLRQPSLSSESGIKQTQRQLEQLERLPPDWSFVRSRQLLHQAQSLWPEKSALLNEQWQRAFDATRLPAEQLNGWHNGMMQLQNLSDKLNRLDEKRGKYMTVSELKSVVFSSLQSFNQSVPAEEELRILSEYPADVPLPVAARTKIEMHLKQLAARYDDLKQQASR